MGCNLIQGYLISRPVPPDVFAELLRSNGPGGPDELFEKSAAQPQLEPSG
jgi:hypothetical protein